MFLTDYNSSYKKLRQNIYGRGYASLAREGRAGENVLRTTLSRLRQRGLIVRAGGEWEITKLGKKYINSLISRRNNIERNKNKAKNLIVAFDIPKKFERERRWLRAELLSLNFSMVQKSVWLGPSPLPKEFIENLNEFKLLPCIKFFKAEQADVL